MKTVVGVFSDIGEARRTIDELMTLGFKPGDISVVTGTTEQGVMKLEMAAVDVSDVGRLAACGPLAEVIRGSGRGALTGSLRYLGLSPDLAAHYTSAVRQGETLESLVVDDKDAERVAEVMEKHAARFWKPTPEAPLAQPGQMPMTGGIGTKEEKIEHINVKEGLKATLEPEGRHQRFSESREEEIGIPIVKEELHVGKREVERGHVHVSVNVLERPVTEHIKLREEHIDIERRAVNRAPRGDETILKGGVMDLTEYAEEAVVSKEARIVEEVVVRKRITSHDEIINATLRSTDVDIRGDGLANVEFKRYLESLGMTGDKFEDHLQAYQFGRSLRGTGKGWEDVEISARERWEMKQPSTWDRFKESIRYGWRHGDKS
jgi:uncharacterized protein (TIGR02271 family)